MDTWMIPTGLPPPTVQRLSLLIWDVLIVQVIRFSVKGFQKLPESLIAGEQCWIPPTLIRERWCLLFLFTATRMCWYHILMDILSSCRFFLRFMAVFLFTKDWILPGY